MNPSSTVIYFGLSLFVLLALIPWVVNSSMGDKSIQTLAIYGGIIVAFLGGMIWGWDEANTSSKNLCLANIIFSSGGWVDKSNVLVSSFDLGSFFSLLSSSLLKGLSSRGSARDGMWSILWIGKGTGKTIGPGSPKPPSPMEVTRSLLLSEREGGKRGSRSRSRVGIMAVQQQQQQRGVQWRWRGSR